MNDTLPAARVATSMALLQAIFDAIEELRVLDPRSADDVRASVQAKKLGDLSHDDLTEILKRIQIHRAPAIIEAPTSHVERDYGIFIDAIPDGRKLVDDIESLALSSSFDELVERTDRVFVDRLRNVSTRMRQLVVQFIVDSRRSLAALALAG